MLSLIAPKFQINYNETHVQYVHVLRNLFSALFRFCVSYIGIACVLYSVLVVCARLSVRAGNIIIMLCI